MAMPTRRFFPLTARVLVSALGFLLLVASVPPDSAAKSASAPPLKPVILPSSKLTLCQYAFAYLRLKANTRKLKVKSNSKPSIVKAKDSSKGDFILLAAGKNYGDSVVTVVGEVLQGNKWVAFTEKVTVSVVYCPKKLPPHQVGGGLVVTPGYSILKTICKGQSYDYTLHVRAPDGSNSLIHVKTESSDSDIATASFDNASQTVNVVGKSPGEATITVSGDVEAVDENIPFRMFIVVTVLDCKSAEVCVGAKARVSIKNAATAKSSNAGVASAGMAGNDVEVTGLEIGSTLITVTGKDGKEVGRIRVKVKKCGQKAPPEKPRPPSRQPLKPDGAHHSFYLEGYADAATGCGNFKPSRDATSNILGEMWLSGNRLHASAAQDLDTNLYTGTLSASGSFFLEATDAYSARLKQPVKIVIAGKLRGDGVLESGHWTMNNVPPCVVHYAVTSGHVDVPAGKK